jgi:hypothetical protein
MSLSYTKKGFIVTPGPRDPLGYFEDSVKLQNGSLILLRMPSQSDNEDTRIVQEYGALMREIVLTTNSLQGITSALYGDSISLETSSITFETEPTRIVIIQDTSDISDTSAQHRNRVHRIDWVLLSASNDVEMTLKKILATVDSKKMHGGFCDFWRIGTGFDPTFLRFEPARKIKVKDSEFFTVEEGNYYFAY